MQETLFGSEPPTLDEQLQDLVSGYGFFRVEAALGRIKIQMNGPLPQVGQRDDDPRTSKGHRSDDVRRFSDKSHSGQLLLVFAGLKGKLGVPTHLGGYTDSEATNHVMGQVGVDCTVSQWEGCRRRCSDLRAAGYIEDTGIERDDRIVWKLTTQGLDAVYQLRQRGWSR